jgi:hypothetical protein
VFANVNNSVEMQHTSMEDITIIERIGWLGQFEIYAVHLSLETLKLIDQRFNLFKAVSDALGPIRTTTKVDDTSIPPNMLKQAISFFLE